MATTPRQPDTSSAIVQRAPSEVTRLVAPKLGITGVPVNLLGTAFIVGFPALYVAFVAASGSLMAFAFGLIGLVTVAFVARALRRAATTHLALDEGGVRYGVGKKASYYPFSVLGRATVETSFLHAAELALVLRDRRGARLATVAFVGRPAAQEALLVADTIERRILLSGTPPSAELAPLERRGRPWQRWIEAIEQFAGGGYRGVAVDPALIEEVLIDPLADVELRGACAYALLRHAETDTRKIVADRLRNREALPPLVTVMARLAAGDAVVSLEVALDAVVYLPLEDRSAAEGGLI